MRCDVCQGSGRIASFECGRCAGRGKLLSFALLNLVTIGLLTACVAGLLGYIAIRHERELPEEQTPGQWHSSTASAEVSP